MASSSSCMPWVYMLRCGDNTLYVGHTRDLAARLHDHRSGEGAHHTAVRLPIDLVYTESCPTVDAAIARERQLKRWSAEKKAALMSGDVTTLKTLSKRRRPKGKS